MAFGENMVTEMKCIKNQIESLKIRLKKLEERLTADHVLRCQLSNVEDPHGARILIRAQMHITDPTCRGDNDRWRPDIWEKLPMGSSAMYGLHHGLTGVGAKRYSSVAEWQFNEPFPPWEKAA